MPDTKDLSEKAIKREMRRQKREARDERRYGNVALRKFVDFQPSLALEYNHYKNLKREQEWNLWAVAFFMLIGAINLFASLFSEGAELTFAFDVLFAMYWLMDYKTNGVQAELEVEKIFRKVRKETLDKAFESLYGEGSKKDGTDEAKKADK